MTQNCSCSEDAALLPLLPLLPSRTPSAPDEQPDARQQRNTRTGLSNPQITQETGFYNRYFLFRSNSVHVGFSHRSCCWVFPHVAGAAHRSTSSASNPLRIRGRQSHR